MAEVLFATQTDLTAQIALALKIASNLSDLANAATARSNLGFPDGAQGEILFYNSAGVPSKLAVGSSGQVLESGGAAADISWETAAGGGNVSNTGTPLNDQIPVWTNATTVEGTSALTFDGTTLTTTGAISCAGFTSTGIDDNATAERLQLGDGTLVYGASGASFSFLNAVNDRAFAIWGGNATSDGAGVQMFGSAHATQAGDVTFFSDADNILQFDANLGTGTWIGSQTWDFGSATSLEIPNSAAPTVDADGEIALDTTITDWSHGLIRYFSTEELFLLAMPVAQLITPSDGEVVAYNATNDELEFVSAGAGDMLIATYDPAGVSEQLVGLVAAQTLTNKTLDDFTNSIIADAQHIEVRNSSGSGMVKGDVIYISGYNVGVDLPEVDLADADGASTFPSIGIIAETIANNASGAVCVTGRMSGLDTSSFSAGDGLFLSTTAGAFSTKPTAATSEVQRLGIVLRSHATLGVIEIVGAGRINDIPNKALDSVFRIADDGDTTKLIMFQASGITTGTTRTITMPDTNVDLGAFLLDTGDTGTGVYDFGGATSFEIPNSATPTVNADGEIAIDTTVTDFSHSVLKYFGGEEMGVVSMPIAQFTTPGDGELVAYNATNDEFELVPSAGGGNVSNTGTPVNNQLAVWTSATVVEGDPELTWDETTLLAKAPAGAAGTLLLQTAETTVVATDVLGRIDFQAPDEADGTDAILVAASIVAEAVATFDASTNTTEIVFMTGVSETAVEQARVKADGFNLVTGNTYQINDTSVLSNNTLGSGVLTSSLTTVGTLATGNADAIVSAATQSLAGKLEVATPTEIDTGTDDGRAVTPDGFAGSNHGIRYISIEVFGPTTNTATGNGKKYVHVPAGLNGMDLVEVHAEVVTAGTTGTTDIQIHETVGAVDMLSTVITIDSGETGSDTAAAAAVIDTANDDIATNDVIRIDVDAVSTTPAIGLIVTLGFRIP